MIHTTDRTTDNKGRVTLPPSFANAKVIIEEVSDTELRIRKALVVPQDEVLFGETLRPLSDRDRDVFLALLDDPPEPNKAFRRAAAKYRKRRG